jgi:hypothetical protein
MISLARKYMHAHARNSTQLWTLGSTIFAVALLEMSICMWLVSGANKINTAMVTYSLTSAMCIARDVETMASIAEKDLALL